MHRATPDIARMTGWQNVLQGPLACTLQPNLAHAMRTSPFVIGKRHALAATLLATAALCDSSAHAMHRIAKRPVLSADPRPYALPSIRQKGPR